MARPLKEGLDYLTLDCNMDTKFKLVEAEYGSKGFAIVVSLWQMIVGGKGYYSEWNDEIALLFVRERRPDCGVNLVNEVVRTCIRRGIFSKELFETYHILTSSGLQKRYLIATARRKDSGIRKEYLLLKVAPKQDNETETPVNDSKNSINTDNNTQSRVKESKGKESRVENPHARQQSDTELYASLCSKYGRSFVDERVERSKQYKGTNMRTVVKWCEEDFGKKPVRKRNGFCNFQERNNDYAELQKQLVQKSLLSNDKKGGGK
jgi:hypothetical protein